jgi:hypothetical protein
VVLFVKLNFIQGQKIKSEKSDEKNIFGIINHIICSCLQQRLEQKAGARM